MRLASTLWRAADDRRIMRASRELMRWWLSHEGADPLEPVGAAYRMYWHKQSERALLHSLWRKDQVVLGKDLAYEIWKDRSMVARARAAEEEGPRPSRGAE